MRTGGTTRRIYIDQTHLRSHVTGIERVTIDLFAPERLAPHEVRPVTSDTLAGMIAGQQLGLPLRALLDRNALFLFPGFPPGPFWRGGAALPVLRPRHLPDRRDRRI